MDDRRENLQETSTRATAFAAIVAAVALLFAVLIWGPGRLNHVESNPGPSGTPGSTAVNGPPPPAENPSGGTVGSAR